MRIAADNIVDAVNELAENGFRSELRLENGQLIDATKNETLKLPDFEIKGVFRFESDPNSGDGSQVFAIASIDGERKGLLIDAFDIINSKKDMEAIKALNPPNAKSTYDNTADASIKYGLRKVFKSDFETAPERYVLRKGFPDFPECPFGQSFSMLGYDKVEHRYVWLVTSIIRDARLRVETFR